jgi:hypothetical protein
VSEKVSEPTPIEERTQEAPEQNEQVPCEVYSRIVGYVRPVRNWNKGKKQEFTERQTYQVDSALNEAAEPECAPAEA